MRETDHYDTLGVTPDATSAQIRAAFRRLVRQRHPDTSWVSGDGAAARDVIAAYRVLGDPAARADYDAERRQRESPPAAPVSRRRMRCTLCGGTGRTAAEVPCATCHGHPEVTVLDHRGAHVERCRRCARRGDTRVSGTCPECGGTGSVNLG